MKFNQRDFNVATTNLFGTAEGKAWLGMIKDHPQINYWRAASLLSSGQDNGCAFYDGVKHPIRIIDQILDNS
jgi:hypothetical protein